MPDLAASHPPTLTTDPPEPLDVSRFSRILVAAVRVSVALMWIQNLNWKVPPDFGQDDQGGLYGWVNEAVVHPVFAPYSWLVENLVLPNFVPFGYLTLLSEFALGVFLLAGLFTRLFALVGIAQTLAITFSVLNAPNEWHWAYYLMLAAHVVLLAVAAGRAYGLDGLLRPSWRRSDSRLAKWAVMAS